MPIQDGYHRSLSSSSQRDVTYSCGSCGYTLNLSSSNRNTSIIGSKYGKSMKRGIISFLSIDESRFQQTDEQRCIPDFLSKHSWGLFRRRTKIRCRKCGNHIGYANEASSSGHEYDGSEVSSANGNSVYRTYDVRIRALQPSSSEEYGTPLVI